MSLLLLRYKKVVSGEIKVVILAEISIFSNSMQGWAIADPVNIIDVDLSC